MASFSAVLNAAVAFSIGAAGQVEKPAARDGGDQTVPIEVNEWSVWVCNPAQTTWNTTRVYKNAMPNTAGTNRPKFEEKDLAGKFAVAPASIVQFFGAPCRDVDVDLRVKKGTILSHWPESEERTGRLQWFGSRFEAAPPAELPPGYLPGDHWFQRLRKTEASLYLGHENHFERFIAYDAELALPVPLKLRGGPNEYTLQNLTAHRLLDVAVIAPSDQSYRVSWLDELPTAVPEKDRSDKDKEKEKEKAKRDKARQSAEEAKRAAAKKAEAVFDEAEAKANAKAKGARDDEEAPSQPMPAEGDAIVQARVDQILNRAISLNLAKAPRRQAVASIMEQARLRYDFDEPTLAKAHVDLNETVELKAGGSAAARDLLADVLSGAGLSYRVTDAGHLFITTAERLSEEADKQGRAIEGPVVKLVMSQPKKPSDPAYQDIARDALARRLAAQGLRSEAVQALLDQYGKALFEPRELIVVAHLSRPAIDEAVLLDVFPTPKKMVRSALLVIHGIDPRLQDRARELVHRLGDPAPKERESAESRLFELGPVAVPVLEDALHDKDLEVVFRAERILLRLNRKVP